MRLVAAADFSPFSVVIVSSKSGMSSICGGRDGIGAFVVLSSHSVSIREQKREIPCSRKTYLWFAGIIRSLLSRRRGSTLSTLRGGRIVFRRFLFAEGHPKYEKKVRLQRRKSIDLEDCKYTYIDEYFSLAKKYFLLGG